MFAKTTQEKLKRIMAGAVLGGAAASLVPAAGCDEVAGTLPEALSVLDAAASDYAGLSFSAGSVKTVRGGSVMDPSLAKAAKKTAKRP